MRPRFTPLAMILLFSLFAQPCSSTPSFYYRIRLVGFIGLACASLASPAAPSTSEPSPHRPRIAVVLSGGAVRGSAHVGVLKALEQQRIPVDFICGTSMGALIGGL